MRSAVDTSVLLDVFLAAPAFGIASREALRQAEAGGSLVACDIVWAEARAYFSSRRDFELSMATLGVSFDACDEETAAAAGEAWKRYREGGGSRSALVPDFLVAAHALRRADRLLTRDRGFTRPYFRGLQILDPSEHPE